MAGLIFLVVLIAFIALLVWVGDLIAKRLAISNGWRLLLLRGSVVAGAFFLLIGDELIGWYQFSAICRQHSAFEMGVSDPVGRTARFQAAPDRELLKSTAIPIYRTRISYFDIQTGELLVALERFEAKGGWLVTLLGVSESDHPILLHRATCSPESRLNEWVAVTLKFNVRN